MLFEWKGTAIYYEYEQHAVNKTAPVLFLHGWGCEHSFFTFYANEIKKYTSVLLIDFPGHGQSTETNGAWSVQDFTEQMVALLDYLHIEKVRVFAHSFGGRVSIKLGANYPQRVESFVITGGAGIRKPITAKVKCKQILYKLCQGVLNSMKRIAFLKKHAEKLQRELRNRNSSPDYLRLSENMKKTFVRVVNEDLTRELSMIQVPVLLLWGSMDTETPLWMGETMEKNIPDAGLVILENGSHFAFLEQKERCLTIVKSFWNLEG